MKIVRIILLLAIITMLDAAENYGLFDSSINWLNICKGPKQKDCCINSSELNSSISATFTMDCSENVLVTKSKIVASSKNKQKYRMQMDKPCKHLFIKPMLQKVFNSSQSCLIQKDKYVFTLNLKEIGQRYYNGMFVYGNWTFESSLFNDKCNFLCFVMEMNVYPRTDH